MIRFRRHFLSCELVRHSKRSRPWEHPDIARNSKPRPFGFLRLAKELGVAAGSIRTWAHQAEADAGVGGTGALTTAEREELSASRKKIRELERERACFS